MINILIANNFLYKNYDYKCIRTSYGMFCFFHSMVCIVQKLHC